MCDLETSRIGAPYIYDISHLRVNNRLIECRVRVYILYFRSRCRWEDNIKIGEHSSLLRCFSVLTGEVTDVSKDLGTFTFRDK